MTKEEVIERLRSCADDPMWANHAEVSKATLRAAVELLAALAAPSAQPPVPEAQMQAMVNRFLGWRLPDTFGPDAGISFNPTPLQKAGTHMWPIGTNLLTATEARAMLEYVCASPSAQPSGAPEVQPTPPVDVLYALRHAHEWIHSAPHGDNCFLTDEHPGNYCNCGKDAAWRSVDDALQGHDPEYESWANAGAETPKEADS